MNPIAAEKPLPELRVAIVHYWFVGRAGGERVVEALAELFPQADLFSLVAERSVMAPILQSRKLQTSFLQHIPGSRKYHRHFLLLQPLALEQFDLSEYDLVISSESGPAKGVITSSKTCHICYCHSPMRYIWEMYPSYRRGMGPVVGAIFPAGCALHAAMGLRQRRAGGLLRGQFALRRLAHPQILRTPEHRYSPSGGGRRGPARRPAQATITSRSGGWWTTSASTWP